MRFVFPTLALLCIGAANGALANVVDMSQVSGIDAHGNQIIYIDGGNENAALLDELGSSNIVNVAQLANSGLSQIVQAGSLNEIDVQQSGIGDQSIVNQTGESSTGNRASVIQMGASDFSSITQDNTVNATALVEQTGSNDSSTILQQNSPFPGGLYAEVHQTVPNAHSEITQTGTLNSAFVFQTVNPGAFSAIFQSGTGNLAIVHQ